MKVTDKLKIETEIPFRSVIDFQFHWCLDAHAIFKLNGYLQSKLADQTIGKDYKGKKLTIEYEDEVMFCGIINKTRLKVTGGLYQVEVEAASATVSLDLDEENEMFQDVSMTYKQMIGQMASKKSGAMIGTIGDEVIEKPLLCYRETVWQYANRMSSRLHSHVIADVKTGEPAFWYGLRKGKNIHVHRLYCEQVEIKKALKAGEKDQNIFLLSGNESYQLCDRILVEGELLAIYDKRAYLRQGEVVFSYLAAREADLYKETNYQEVITGLSLPGIVEKVENEQIYIRLDLDGKPGQYPFPWYPETGNILYAMPEPGARVEIYFMGADERNAIGVRCRDIEGTDCGEKRLERTDGTKISMNTSVLELNKSGTLTLADHKVDLRGNKEIGIAASGKVELEAGIVEIYAADAIDYTTEW